MRSFQTMSAAAVAAVAVAMLTACGQQATSPSTPSSQQPQPVNVSATFATADQAGPALTYDPKLVPAGATATVTATAADGKTTVTLKVAKLPPNRKYGSHAHTKPCGSTGDAAGPHFQYKADPKTPSTDPAFANAQNEIWLDFTTDAGGEATAAATVSWVFDANRAKSVIIHAMPTATEAGKAGTAGARVGCVTVDF